jgi:hypothetical protein
MNAPLAARSARRLCLSVCSSRSAAVSRSSQTPSRASHAEADVRRVDFAPLSDGARSKLPTSKVADWISVRKALDQEYETMVRLGARPSKDAALSKYPAVLGLDRVFVRNSPPKELLRPCFQLSHTSKPITCNHRRRPEKEIGSHWYCPSGVNAATFTRHTMLTHHLSGLLVFFQWIKLAAQNCTRRRRDQVQGELVYSPDVSC